MDEPNRDKDTCELESAVSLTPRLSSATPRLAGGGFLTTQSEKNLTKNP